MSNVGDDFKAMREDSRGRRAGNRQRGAQRLAELGIAFDSLNFDAHLLVRKRIDYWPGTGLWVDRDLPSRGRGLRSLLDHLETLS